MTGREHEILSQAGRVLGGLEFFQKMVSGELPLPPLAALLGIRMLEVARGSVVLEADPAPALRDEGVGNGPVDQ
jgi:hypothetical protein